MNTKVIISVQHKKIKEKEKKLKALGKMIYSRRKTIMNKNKNDEMKKSTECGGT